MAKTLTTTSIAVTINGNDYSKHVMFPFKVSNLLDEQLDEASLTLIGVPEKNFKPLTDVIVTLKNGNKTQSYSMLVASDKADEIPTGSGRYKHELYLIEQTKYLECFIVRSIGYLNPLEKSYDVIQAPYFANYTLSKGDWSPEYDAEFLTPQYITGNTLKITAPPMCRNYSLLNGICRVPSVNTSFLVIPSKDAKISLKKDGIVLQEYTTDWVLNGNEVVYNSYQVVFDAVDFYVDSPGLYQIEYSNFHVTIEFDGSQVNTGSLIYDIAVLESTPTGDKWNARTVIRRALIIAETLLQGEVPRFRLDGDISYYDVYGNQIEFLGDFDTLADLETAYPSSNIGDLAWAGDITYRWSGTEWENNGTTYPLSKIAKWLQTIETPEFQFTQSTLREVLQSVGKFIHAEPRLMSGGIITFDKLGSGEISNFTDTNYGSKSYQQAVDRYATNLYSTVDNFVNSINYANGVMVEPYSNGLKTVRTEDVYTKITDENIYISTQYPIRSIVKVECGLVDGFENQISAEGGFVDITPFVYESAEYKRLSSYNGAYPMSKAWAIYYTIGQKGINGLNFKPESALLKDYQKYAIVNILNAITNNSQTETTEQQLAFRVTYEPIYSATAQQNKSYVGDIDKPASLVYNQGQNLVESHYYGENLKGAIARLGNVDKVLTYVKHGLVDAPKVGQILMDGDDEYYISAVASEIQPYYTKFSMSLSKDFNRYSDYVGVNSQKRMYEVSERQAFDSHITYKDYVVIGDIEVYEKNDDGLVKIDDGLVRLGALNGIFAPDNNGNNGLNSLSLAELQGYDNGGNALQKVALPIQKSAIGNSALFTIKYQDNYSAGDNIVKVDNNYWQNGVAYSDYFGNIESLEMTLRKDGASPSNYAKQSEIGNALPLYDFEDDLSDQWISTKNVDKRLWVKKGSTEIPTIDYQIDFVTNRSDIIIGSALAKNLPLICGDLGAEHTAKLYLLKNRLNKFDKIADISNADEYTFSLSLGDNFYLFDTDEEISEEYKSWAIVDGATNELLVGCNKTITTADEIFNEKTNTADESPKGLKMFIKHDIFKDKKLI